MNPDTPQPPEGVSNPEQCDSGARGISAIVRKVLNGSVVLRRRLRNLDGMPDQNGGQSKKGLGTNTDAWPTVAIVVLTWENYEEVRDCLTSLRSVSYPDYQVIVVDNGSQDNSVDSLQREFDWVEFVCNDENLGFARGNNTGIRYALDTDADYVLLLNDDTIVPEDFLTPLVRTIVKHDRVAAVGGINRDFSGRIHNAGYEFYPSLAGQAVRYLRPRDISPYSVGYVQSCLVLLDPEFLSEIGLLGEQYFLGMEDVDLAWKAHRKGWQVLMNPESEIFHRVGATSDDNSFNVYHRTRNRLTFANENLSTTRTVLFLLSFAVAMIFSYLRWGLDSETRKMEAAILAVIDYFTGHEFRSYEDLM